MLQSSLALLSPFTSRVFEQKRDLAPEQGTPPTARLSPSGAHDVKADYKTGDYYHPVPVRDNEYSGSSLTAAGCSSSIIATEFPLIYGSFRLH